MTDTIKISRDELQRIAQGCSCEVTTDALDALLATPPADAADMGGQAGEALSACRSELHAMITAHNVQSEHDGSWLYDYQTVSEADEALADWEKTK